MNKDLATFEQRAIENKFENKFENNIDFSHFFCQIYFTNVGFQNMTVYQRMLDYKEIGGKFTVCDWKLKATIQ